MGKHEIIMLLSGILLLFSLLAIDGFGFKFWIIAKIFYFVGLVLMFKKNAQ